MAYCACCSVVNIPVQQMCARCSLCLDCCGCQEEAEIMAGMEEEFEPRVEMPAEIDLDEVLAFAPEDDDDDS